MKILFTLLLLLPVSAFCQRDFDFTFYTWHAKIKGITKDTTSDLFLTRQIKKEGNSLRIMSLGNTADCQEYKLKYDGMYMQKDTWYFMYLTQDSIRVTICPMQPWISVGDYWIYY